MVGSREIGRAAPLHHSCFLIPVPFEAKPKKGKAVCAWTRLAVVWGFHVEKSLLRQ